MERITLDNTNYEELLEKAVSRIPELCPDWKNTRQSDPGITIIQLMAALTDIQNYTVDSVSKQHKKGYIKLLGGAKRGVRFARAAIEGLNAELIKGERVKIGRKTFEYSGVEQPDGELFIQKETLIQSVDFLYGSRQKDPLIFSLWNALNGTARVFKQTDNNIWQPVEFSSQKEQNFLSIQINHSEKNGRYRAVFYDRKAIAGYYKESGIVYPEDGIIGFAETSGVTMQKIKIFEPKPNDIMPQMLKLWVNYGSYYEEIGFNPIKDGEITLGNGRDFPILKGGGKIEAFSLVLTKGATSLSSRQPVRNNKGEKIKNAAITVLSEGRNAETADEALARINGMLAPKTCVTAADYAKKINKLCGSEIKKLKVKSDSGVFNKIIIYAALLKKDGQKPFSHWRNELLKKLQPHKLLTVSFEIHEIRPIPVTVEGEIALNANCGVEIQEEIRRRVSELCEKETGSPVNSHTLTEKILKLPQIKRINRLHIKYDESVKNADIKDFLFFLDKFSVNFILS